MNTAPPPSPSASEPWLAQMAQAMDEIVWVRDAVSGRVLFVNAAFEHFWGLGLPDVTDAPNRADVLLERIHPDDRARVQLARERLAASAYVEEYGVERPDGRNGRLRERAFHIRGPQRDWYVHIARDVSWQFDTTAQLHAEISRRTDAERSLSDANLRLRKLIDTANDAVVTIDEAGLIVDWNTAAERIFGWRRDEALGERLTELIIPPAYRDQHDAGIQRYLRGGGGQLFNRRVEALALRRGGEAFDVEMSIWPVRTAEGCTFSSFIRDISRRKAAERALAESETKYRAVVENVNEGILVTSGGRILYANPKAFTIIGRDETAISQPFIDFIHPDDRARVLDNHLRRLRGEAVENRYLFRVLHANGETRWLEISAVVFEWQGEPATLNFLTDATERRRIEQEMHAALARERELSELKSRFVALASHEFRTPLAAILSSVELLDAYGTRLPDAERRDIIGVVRNAVARMNKMVEQVLLTSRLEAGALRFEPQPQPFAQLLAQVVTELDKAHTGAAARLSMHCEGLETARMLDAKLVDHILVNLLGNALKYSATDAPVQCRAHADGETLHLCVADQGIGIHEADLPRLFERFHRGANVGGVQGTGIGLHIVKECVELHGGAIEVDSRVGEGTTFHIRLRAPVVA